MLLWRLSGRQHAQALDGGYGLHFDGRWNTAGHAVTYCATSPSLCVLEKLVHVEDPDLLPELVMVTYEFPDSIGIEDLELGQLRADWRQHEAWTQQKGDGWHQARNTPLLRVPSAIVPVAGSPDLNVIVNHNHPASADLRVIRSEAFSLDSRLL